MARPKPTKSTRKADEFKERAAVYRDRLDFYDPVQNNNKFWYIDVHAPVAPETVFYIVRRWGRNGTNGQSMVEEFSHTHDATSYASDLAASKRREGYKPDPSLLVKIAREVGDDA